MLAPTFLDAYSTLALVCYEDYIEGRASINEAKQYASKVLQLLDLYESTKLEEQDDVLSYSNENLVLPETRITSKEFMNRIVSTTS